jgi:hypothetical protein
MTLKTSIDDWKWLSRVHFRHSRNATERRRCALVGMTRCDSLLGGNDILVNSGMSQVDIVTSKARCTQ